MLNKLRLCFNNGQRKIVSDNFTVEHGGCFALLAENSSNSAELFLFTDGTINLAEHIISNENFLFHVFFFLDVQSYILSP